MVRQYRIDDTYSNSWTFWKEIGAPQNPTAEQYAKMEAAGQLQEFSSPKWVTPEGGEIKMDMSLPLAAVSLVQVSW
jgi:xylan 1,4-beta-xylosidase